MVFVIFVTAKHCQKEKKRHLGDLVETDMTTRSITLECTLSRTSLTCMLLSVPWHLILKKMDAGIFKNSLIRKPTSPKFQSSY